MVQNTLNWAELLDKRKDCITGATKFPNGSKQIRCSNFQLVKYISKTIVKKRKVNVIKKIQLLKNKFILRKLLAAGNNKKVVLIDEGRRNKNSTNHNEKSYET